MEQGSLEWFDARYARVTMSEGVTTLMNGGVVAKNTLLRTIRERRTHSSEQIEAAFRLADEQSRRVPNFEWGHEQEPKAIAYYELTRNINVIRPGFSVHYIYDWCGASIDFIERSDAETVVGEVKCPADRANHLANIAYRDILNKYYNQIQGGIECSGADYAKFLSYDPREPLEENILCVIRVDIDMAWRHRFLLAAESFDRHLNNGTDYEAPYSKATDGLPSMF